MKQNMFIFILFYKKKFSLKKNYVKKSSNTWRNYVAFINSGF